MQQSAKPGEKTAEDSSEDTPARAAAERAGYAALLAGHGFSANPHRRATAPVECTAWVRGWAAARTDLKRENAKLR